jgi:hypothetical protein
MNLAKFSSADLHTLSLLVLAAVSAPIPIAAASSEAGYSEQSVGNVQVTTRLIFNEAFESMENWKALAPNTRWTMEAGKLKGYWAPGGSALWLDRELEGNLLLVAQARLLPPDPDVAKPNRPEGSRNFNLRFHVRGPGDVDILDVYRKLLEAGTGLNGIGDDQYLGYFITWTWRHSRLRRSPGYVNVSESTDYLPESLKFHLIPVLFLDGRILYTTDGKLLHDYTDPRPFTRGKVAIVTSNSNVEVSKFEVYQVVGAKDLPQSSD